MVAAESRRCRWSMRLEEEIATLYKLGKHTKVQMTNVRECVTLQDQFAARVDGTIVNGYAPQVLNERFDAKITADSYHQSFAFASLSIKRFSILYCHSFTKSSSIALPSYETFAAIPSSSPQTPTRNSPSRARTFCLEKR